MERLLSLEHFFGDLAGRVDINSSRPDNVVSSFGFQSTSQEETSRLLSRALELQGEAKAGNLKFNTFDFNLENKNGGSRSTNCMGFTSGF